jgi:hypothetical protein
MLLPNVLDQARHALAQGVRSTTRDSCGCCLWGLVRLSFVFHASRQREAFFHVLINISLKDCIK